MGLDAGAIAECTREEFEPVKREIMRLEGHTSFPEASEEPVRVSEAWEARAHMDALKKGDGDPRPPWGNKDYPAMKPFTRQNFEDLREDVEEFKKSL